MSDNTKEKKEELLKQLLTANPEITMKEANVSIRESFDTGVSGPVFSKVKKALLGDGQSPSEVPEPASSEAAPPQAEAEAPSESVQSEASDSAPSPEPGESEQSQENNSTPSNEDKKASEDNKADASEEGAEESPQEEEEPEIDPNLPRFPVRLEIHAPEAKTVHLAGSFNRWCTSEYPLAPTGEGFWAFDGDLPQGEYSYKFVIDGNTWWLDMHKERVIDKTGVSHPITIGEASPE